MPPRLTEAERQRIIALYETGLSLRAIALDVKCSHNTVRYWCRVFREENRIGPLQPGRPKSSLSALESDPDFLLTVAKDHPELSQNSDKSSVNLDCNKPSVKLQIPESILHREIGAYTDRDQRELLEFADDHGGWNFDQWSSVVFSDEHHFPLSDDGFDDFQVKKPRMDHRRPQRVSILVWACLTSQGLGPLHRIDNVFDSEAYKDVLRDVMVPFVRQGPFPDGAFLFQHNRSPIHNSRVVRDLLHDRKIQEIVWPVKGAELSPMCGVWKMLKKPLALMDPPPANREELWETVYNVWEQLKLDRDIARELVSELPEKLQELVQENGND